VSRPDRGCLEANVGPTVSVVIGTHNRAATVVESVNSVLRQTYSDLEVVVVDDGSTDGTAARLATLTDPRLRVVSSPVNEGVSVARNRGVHASGAPWVAFQDSDDEWLPTKLELQMARLEHAGAQAVGAYCGLLVVGGPAHRNSRRTSVGYVPPTDESQVEGDILEGLLRTSLISTQTMVVRRDLLTQVGGFDEELGSLVDWDLALRLARLGPWAFVDEPLVVQRFSPNSLTHNVARRAASTARVVEKNRDLLEQRPDLLAHHLRTVAGGYRRVGLFDHAQDYLGRARAVQPLSVPLWGMTAWTALAGLRGGVAARRPRSRIR
jgi:glycosyltransferase involved in cell wall biosynthesis